MVLKDMEPMGWQDTERGHTGTATVMHEVRILGQFEGLCDTSDGLINRSAEFKIRKEKKE